MKVFIVRHGETNWNIKNRVQGKSDIPLNETGLEQAQKIANRLRLVNLDVIISSPLIRAKFTAQNIAKYHPKAKLIINKNLAEVSFGDWEGLGHKEIAEKFGIQKLTTHEEYSMIPPKGESLEQRVEKLIPLVEKWKKIYQDKNILLSTHGYIKKGILIAFKVATYESLKGLRFDNAALTIVKPFDIPNIELLNDTTHLN